MRRHNPKVASECPASIFVTECTTTSAPWSNGNISTRRRKGVVYDNQNAARLCTGDDRLHIGHPQRRVRTRPPARIQTFVWAGILRPEYARRIGGSGQTMVAIPKRRPILRALQAQDRPVMWSAPKHMIGPGRGSAPSVTRRNPPPCQIPVQAHNRRAFQLVSCAPIHRQSGVAFARHMVIATMRAPSLFGAPAVFRIGRWIRPQTAVSACTTARDKFQARPSGATRLSCSLIGFFISSGSSFCQKYPGGVAPARSDGGATPPRADFHAPPAAPSMGAKRRPLYPVGRDPPPHIPRLF